MRKLKNKIKSNFRKNVTKAAIIATAGFGAMAVTVPAFADEMHHCSCGENHDDPNCKCGCQEAKALVELTKGEWETSQKDLNSKREVQKQLEEVLEAAKKAHEEYQAALQKQIDENLQKAQDAYDEAKALLDAANATSDEAGKELDDAATAYEEAQKALEEAENLLAELEASNPDIEKEYEADLAELEQAEKELEQAIEDEEKAQAEKEAADKAAEEAKQKREAAREAREKARQAAEDAEKRKADAEAAKKAADEAQADAQSKYNEADEAYSYKKGLADGTIPIESTPEWEEAQKTQAALDEAAAEKEKADGELQKAEEDLAEKEKALEAANADFEEKNKVCEETRAKLKAAREELEAAQKENAEDKEALENAKKEKDDADKDVANKETALENADKALEDAKKAKEDAQKALEDAEKAKKDAEEALQKFKDEQRNSVAFCKWVVANSTDENLVADAQAALDIYEKHMGEGASTKLTGKTDLTDETDSTDLDNMLESVKFLEETNALRKYEGYDPNPLNGSPEGYKQLSDLRVSLRLMMIAQLQLNWSDSEEDHSEVENVGENLAWGQQNKANVDADINEPNGREAGPYAGWYTDEKKIFDDNNPHVKKAYTAVGILEEALTYVKDAPNDDNAKQKFVKCLYELQNYAGSINITYLDKTGRHWLLSKEAFQTLIDKIENNTVDLNDPRNNFWTDFEKENKTPSYFGVKKDEAGHYLNIVNSTYNITGFAYNQGAAAKYGSRAYGQTFSRVNNTENYPTVASFSKLLNTYADETNAEQEKLQKALEDAEKALEDANTSLESATQDVTDKTNAKADAENALDDAKQTQEDKKNALDDATTKEATSSKRLADAETALGLRTQENETAEEELTTAQEAQEEAQTQADAASGAKEEKKKEADKKNETFTEAKNADDKADQIVQDLLDGKEVPALEGAKNEAGAALDNANQKKAAADKELKDAGDDLKAKNDDLNKKTAEEEAAEKDKNEKETDAKNKNDALNGAKNKKTAAEDKKKTAQTKTDDAKKRLDDVNAARDGKADAAKTADGAKANKDAAQKKADEAKANLGTVTTQADEAKAVLDEAMKLDVSTVIAHPDEYDTFADGITALNKAIQDEEAAGKNYTAAENDCVVAEADEQEKKGAYDDAVAKNAMAHEHCGHDEHMEASYRCTAGDGNEWTKGAKATSDFTFERSMEDETTFGRFKGIKIDGKDVGAANYTTASGSVVVKLKPEYLETLTVGEHTIKAEFDDGSASAKFSVKAAAEVKPAVTPQNTTPSQPAVTTVTSAPVTAAAPVVVQTAKSAPATGDRNGNVWIVTAAVTGAAAAVMAGAVIYRRKKG